MKKQFALLLAVSTLGVLTGCNNGPGVRPPTVDTQFRQLSGTAQDLEFVVQSYGALGAEVSPWSQGKQSVSIKVRDTSTTTGSTTIGRGAVSAAGAVQIELPSTVSESLMTKLSLTPEMKYDTWFGYDAEAPICGSKGLPNIDFKVAIIEFKYGDDQPLTLGKPPVAALESNTKLRQEITYGQYIYVSKSTEASGGRNCENQDRMIYEDLDVELYKGWNYIETKVTRTDEMKYGSLFTTIDSKIRNASPSKNWYGLK